MYQQSGLQTFFYDRFFDRYFDNELFNSLRYKYKFNKLVKVDDIEFKPEKYSYISSDIRGSVRIRWKNEGKCPERTILFQNTFNLFQLSFEQPQRNQYPFHLHNRRFRNLPKRTNRCGMGV